MRGVVPLPTSRADQARLNVVADKDELTHVRSLIHLSSATDETIGTQGISTLASIFPVVRLATSLQQVARDKEDSQLTVTGWPHMQDGNCY